MGAAAPYSLAAAGAGGSGCAAVAGSRLGSGRRLALPGRGSALVGGFCGASVWCHGGMRRWGGFRRYGGPGRWRGLVFVRRNGLTCPAWYRGPGPVPGDRRGRAGRFGCPRRGGRDRRDPGTRRAAQRRHVGDGRLGGRVVVRLGTRHVAGPHRGVHRNLHSGHDSLPAQCRTGPERQLWMIFVWWQKCTREAPEAWTRCSDDRQATGSAAWPGTRSWSGGPAYWCGV